MPAFAVIGATGNTGSALTKIFLRDPDVQVHAYCRSKAKLARAQPEAIASPRLEVFEGSIDDADLLARCISGCQAVFLVASTNDNIPNYDVGQRAAGTILRALQILGLSPHSTERKQTGKDSTVPKVVLLSSATLDDALCKDTPQFLRIILKYSESNVYEDLKRTEAMLRAEQHWLKTIFIKPGALVVDEAHGHALSFTSATSPLSYMDLAEGMIEAARAPNDAYDMKNVGVVAPTGRTKIPWNTPFVILTGLLRHFLPGLHAYIPLAS